MKPRGSLSRAAPGLLTVLAVFTVGCARPATDGGPASDRTTVIADTTPAPASIASPSSPRSFYYRCPDEVRFVAQLLDGGDRVRLLLPDTTVVLQVAVSASGARYAEGPWTYWSKGEEARLETPDTTRTGCLIDRGKPWLDAHRRGVDFRASGNEPGWFLEIDEGHEIVLVTNYGETRHHFPTPEVQRGDGRITYRTEAEGHALRVTVEEKPCRDDMSGWPFEAAVVVAVDGQEYRGCGRSLESFAGGSGAGSGAQLDGTTWQLVRLDGEATDPELPEITLAFEGDRARGSGGCNWYTGFLEEQAVGRLSVGSLAATRRACAHPRIMDREARYLAALEGAAGYELGNHGLRIRYRTADGGGTLEFGPVGPDR